MGTHSINNFNVGLLSPLMLSRTDLDQYYSGLQELQNFQILPQGGLTRRPGTKFSMKLPDDPYKGVLMVPFIYSRTESYIIVFTVDSSYNGLIYFIENGGDPVESGGGYYTIAHPYTGVNDLDGLRWIQQNDVLFLAHPDYNLRRLERYGDADWELVAPDFDEGPYLPENTDDDWTIAATDNNDGTAALAASGSPAGTDTFTSLNAKTGAGVTLVPGSLFTLKHKRSDVAVDGELFSRNYVYFYSGSTEPSIGDYLATKYSEIISWGTLVGWQAKGSYGKVVSVEKTGGEWANGDATGKIWLNDVHGWFADDEIYNITTMNTNVLTISEGMFSKEISGKGEWKLTTHGRWTGNIVLQRSFDNGENWHTYRAYSSEEDNNVLDTGNEEERATLRLQIVTAEGGTCNYNLVLFDYYYETVLRVTSITDADTATADIVSPSDGVLKDSVDGEATNVWAEGAWSRRRGFPSQLAFFEQRLLMAATSKQPQTFWGSRVDDYTNFDLGTEDDAPYQYTISSDRRNPIQWMISHRYLMIGTWGGVWRVSGGNSYSDPVTPTKIVVRREISDGTDDAFVMGTKILFLNYRRTALIEMSYDYVSDQFEQNDMSILAPELLSNEVRDFGFSRDPYTTAWFSTKSGELFSFTREPQHKINGWAEHVLGESANLSNYPQRLAVIPGDYGDELFISVARSGTYIEFIQPEHWSDLEDAPYLDSHIVAKHDPPQTTIDGLDHLEGEEVEVWAEGTIQGLQTVSGGEITIDIDYETGEVQDVIVGLPYASYLKTMPLPFVPDKKARIPEITAALHKTILGYARTTKSNWKSGGTGSPNDYALLVPRAVLDNMDSPQAAFSGPRQIQVASGLENQIEIEISTLEKPTPLTLLGLHIGNIVWE